MATLCYFSSNNICLVKTHDLSLQGKETRKTPSVMETCREDPGGVPAGMQPSRHPFPLLGLWLRHTRPLLGVRTLKIVCLPDTVIFSKMYLFIYSFMYDCISWPCHMAYGILLPWPGMEPVPPCSGSWVLTGGPSGIPQADVFVVTSFCTHLVVAGTLLVLRSTFRAIKTVYTMLSDSNVTTHAFFWWMFAWFIFLHSLIVNMFSLYLK